MGNVFTAFEKYRVLASTWYQSVYPKAKRGRGDKDKEEDKPAAPDKKGKKKKGEEKEEKKRPKATQDLMHFHRKLFSSCFNTGRELEDERKTRVLIAGYNYLG